jgi:hypothetical protein
MLNVKEAVRKAQTYLPEVFESAAGASLQLEGVELSEDSKFWLITFSYYPKDALVDSEGTLLSSRQYKTIKLDAMKGELLGARNAFVTAWA